MSEVAVAIVGGGGIGSAVLQYLSRFLSFEIDIHIIDGDSVAGKNIQRQGFSKKHLGQKKAIALQEIATGAVGLDRVYYHDQYITDTTLLHKIAKHYQRMVLIGCVDNHPARRRMEAFAREVTIPLYYLDCANEEDRGEVVAVLACNGLISGAFRSEIDPSVATDESGDPTTASCGELLDGGNMQTLYTNCKAAITAVELTSDALAGNPQVGIVFFKKAVIERMVPAAENEEAMAA